MAVVPNTLAPGGWPVARVVLVDDSDEYRRLVTLALGNDTRFAVVAEAADGVAGLAAVTTHVPDLVVTDLHMPEVDGIELTRAIRRIHGDLPVVMVTGLPGDDLVQEARQAGVSAFLAKTGSITRLTDTLQAVLEGRLPQEPVAAG